MAVWLSGCCCHGIVSHSNKEGHPARFGLGGEKNPDSAVRPLIVTAGLDESYQHGHFDGTVHGLHCGCGLRVG